ncbi:hypothetical protein ACWDAO_12570 [Streptomyces sp. NPDC001212]
MTAEDGTYHALLARHDAMRLRRQMLSSGGFPGADGCSADGLRGPAGQPYDGSADQQTIMRDLDLVAPFEELIAHLYL